MRGKMRYSRVLLSLLVCSSLSYGADKPEAEYQINFSTNGDTFKTPEWTPPFTEKTDFTWDQEKGRLIFDSTSTSVGGSKPPKVTATFKSDASNSGILTLKNFNFINGYKPNGSITLPTDISQITAGSTLTIANDSTNAFKGFTLGEYQGSSGSVNLYAGTNLEISGFDNTVIKGSISVQSGRTMGLTSGDNPSETTLYDIQEASLGVSSENAYSSLNMGASLVLDTYNGDKTKEKAVASFVSKVEGDTKIGGGISVYDKAEARIASGNSLEIGSAINIYAQEAKKITQDSLGNQSISEEDRNAKKTNLTLESVKITLNGSISVGTGAVEMVSSTNSSGITTITTNPTDIGARVEIYADIGKKSSKNTGGTAPQGWEEAKKAQFIGSGSFSVGKNSEVILRTINSNNTSNFDEKDPYAITLSSVRIEDQIKGNKVLNFDAQAHLQKGSASSYPYPAVGKNPSELGNNAGKIYLNGSISLGANANMLVQSYDGIEASANASFSLSSDSLLWLKGKMSGESLENKGGISSNGGAFVLGNVYGSKNAKGLQNLETLQTTLTNTGSTTISGSYRTTTEPLPTRPPQRAGGETPPSEPIERELDPSGVFLLAKDNTFDNQGSLNFEGGGNLTSATSSNDGISRSLSITNSKGAKGAINVKGAKNSIISSGSLALSSQNIGISSKTLDDGSVEEGELILSSISMTSDDSITIGSSQPNSGKDKVSVSGGTLKISSLISRVGSYNLRLTNATLDLSNLASANNLADVATLDSRALDTRTLNGAFSNLRTLELGGNVNIVVKKEKSSFINGVIKQNTLPPNTQSNFETNLATMQVQGNNKITTAQIGSGTFGFDNYGVLDLKSNATLSIDGDMYNNGSIVFSGDQFGLGALSLSGDLVLDMTQHQSSNTVNPLIAINHTNFHSLSLYQGYLLIQTQGEIKYQVGNALISASAEGGGEITPRSGEAPSYGSLQSALKTEMEDYLNGKNAYEGNPNKLGVFLNGVALIGVDYIGFGVTRSEAISQLTIDQSATGLIDQYLKVLSGSDGPISEKKTQEMVNAIYASDPKAMQALNNALQVQNGLELGILKDIGSYNTSSLISTAQAIQEVMKSTTYLIKPVLEDFKKMQVVREIAVQNRMVRASNPFTAQAELEQLVQSMVGTQYASNEVANKTGDGVLSDASNAEVLAPFLFDDRIAFKNNVWLSAITSSTKTSLDTSALYGLSLGYEHMPLPNVLFGFYAAYGYSNYKSDTLKNNAHNIDLSLYTRLYYGASEIDLTLSYIHGFNQADTQFNNNALNQSFSFQSHNFDFSAKYGYVLETPLKGMFLKPQATFTLYGVGTPNLQGEGENPVELAKQSMDGILFGLGLEVRQYISPVSYIYLLPSFDYNMYKKDNNSSVSFLNAYNKMSYALLEQGHYIFSLYAGGEGYVSHNLAINVSAGYKGALDMQDHNLSISAGLKYKF